MMKKIKQVDRLDPVAFSYLIPGILWIVLLIAVCIPLLMLANYAYPAADDYSFAADVRHVLEQQGGVFALFYAAIRRTAIYWLTWQGSFAAIFLFMFQPGVFDASFYGIGTWILIAGLLYAQWFFFSWLICDLGKQPKRICLLPWSMICVLQLLFMPVPVEAFYWFNGSLYYTFFYSLSLIYLTLLGRYSFSGITTQSPHPPATDLPIRMISRYLSKWIQWLKHVVSKQKALCAVTMLLGLMIGGGNLATGLCVCVIEFCLIVLVFSFARHRLRLLLPGIGCNLLGFLLNVLAPGNSVRQNMLEGHASPIWAITRSLRDAAECIGKWTDYKALLFLLLLLPLLWRTVSHMSFKFPLPGVFLVVTFSIYASQMTAVAYAYGLQAGVPDRMMNVWWESYWILLVLWEMYLLGYLRRRFSLLQKLSMYHGPIAYLLYSLIGTLVLSAVISIPQTTSYEAWREIRTGEAAAYAKEWQARIDILSSEPADVFLPKLQNKSPLLYYGDIEDDPGYWYNANLAYYFHKRSVHGIPE
jgi:hypothetical protein